MLRVCVQTFSCEAFDDGMQYLRAELLLKCDGSPERKLYLFVASVALFAYPIGKPPHTRGNFCTTSDRHHHHVISSHSP